MIAREGSEINMMWRVKLQSFDEEEQMRELDELQQSKKCKFHAKYKR